MKQKVVVIFEDEVAADESLITELMDEGCDVNCLYIKKGLLSEISATRPDVLVFLIKQPTKSLLETIKIINFSEPKPMIVLAQEQGLIASDEVIKSGVSSYIVDGYKPGRMKCIFEVALARFDEYQSLYKELHSVKEKLEDRKLIDKAKGLLMQLRGVDEDSAYGMMRRMAMENNRRLVDIAKNIISVTQVADQK